MIDALDFFLLCYRGPSIETPPPRLGQHPEEVRRELGDTGEKTAALRVEGAI